MEKKSMRNKIFDNWIDHFYSLDIQRGKENIKAKLEQ